MAPIQTLEHSSFAIQQSFSIPPLMSAATTETSPTGSVISFENLLFDYPEADLILRSRDSYEFRVLKIYIVHSSPIFGEKVLISPNPQPELTTSTIPAESNVEGTTANALPVVQLPIEGTILFSLLTYIFPVPPVLPSTVEQVMELLSVAQMYKMDIILTHIRSNIAQQEPPFVREETAFLIYSLAQKYGLRTEALQAARCTLSFSSLTIKDLAEENKLDMMPGAFLHGLWKYHQRVRSNLKLDLEEFRKSNVMTILGNWSCVVVTNSGFPHWLHRYIAYIGVAHIPVYVDLTDFHMQLTKHVQWRGGCKSCSGISREKIRVFWRALTAVIRGSIAKAEADLALLLEGTKSQCQARPTREVTSPPKYSNMPNADIVLQSSDLVDFRVHKSALVASSPFFDDMFSLPQPPNDTSPDQLPVLHLSEDAEVLNSLVSMLYPVPPEMPHASDNILSLLAAAEKYDMSEVQSSIRAEINRRGLLSSTPAEVFRVYAIACNKGLLPEMASSARLSLGHPLTFKTLGDALGCFEGWALRELANFRQRSMDNFSSNLRSFSNCIEGPSKIWTGCSEAKVGGGGAHLPFWLERCFWSEWGMSKWPDFMLVDDRFAQTVPTAAELCDEYLNALQSHVKDKDCHFCLRVHALEGEKYCEELKKVSTEVWNIPTPTLERNMGL